MSDVERRDEGIVDRVVEWTLIDGSRWTVAGGSLVPIVVLLGWWREQLVLTNTGPLQFLFSALIGGNFTLITVVLSVNQLVLSRQLEALGEVRSQIEEVHDYRNEVEARAPRASLPSYPRSSSCCCSRRHAGRSRSSAGWSPITRRTGYETTWTVSSRR